MMMIKRYIKADGIFFLSVWREGDTFIYIFFLNDIRRFFLKKVIKNHVSMKIRGHHPFYLPPKMGIEEKKS